MSRLKVTQIKTPIVPVLVEKQAIYSEYTTPEPVTLHPTNSKMFENKKLEDSDKQAVFIADTIPLPYRDTEEVDLPKSTPKRYAIIAKKPGTRDIKLEQNDSTSDNEGLQPLEQGSFVVVKPLKTDELLVVTVPEAIDTRVVNEGSEAEVPYFAEFEEQDVEQITISEAIQVYLEIIALAEKQGNEASSGDMAEASGESSEITGEDPKIAETLIATTETVNPLQILSEQYPQPKRQIELAEIKNNANDQSLGETIMQLAVLFSEDTVEAQNKIIAPETTINSDEIEIKTMLKEIAQELEKQTDDTETIKITPEITNMLLILLQTLGYDNPRETLLEFVAQNNVMVLLQSVKSLHSLSDDSYKEFITNTTQPIFTTPSANSTSSYIGRVLLELITPLVYQKV